MNQSLWKAATDNPPRYPSLQKNIEVDVAIVGGGITGMTAAYNLVRQGKTVAILEADILGNGTTGFSTGNLYVPVQPYFQNLERKFNFATAQQVAQARNFAIDFIEQAVVRENISCHFHRRPWYLYTDNEKKIKKFNKEIDIYQRLGLPINQISELPLPFKFKKAVELPNQARFNPYQYVLGLAKAVAKQDGLIFEKTRVLEFNEDKHCQLITEHGKVTSRAVLLATHTPVGINLTQTFTAPYRSYVIATKIAGNRYPEGHFWNMEEPHLVSSTHAFRGKDPELLLISGSHHKTGQDKDANEHFKMLFDLARQDLEIESIEFRWSAQHYQSADGIPYIGLQGRTAKNIYMATGYFADGLTYGTLAGVLFADKMLDKAGKWNKTFNSLRFKPIASAPFVSKENTNVFMQYMKDLPLPASKFADLQKGEAKVVEVNREKFGAYRDDQNQLHVVSAVCTHMKCIIGWNTAEKTWDCPCHGSRFDIHGEIIEGPALYNLRKKTIKEN